MSTRTFAQWLNDLSPRQRREAKIDLALGAVCAALTFALVLIIIVSGAGWG